MAKPTIPEQFGQQAILDLIKENQPISTHALYKLSTYGSYSGMWDCIERLEKKDLVVVEKVPVDKYEKMVRIKEHDYG